MKNKKITTRLNLLYIIALIPLLLFGSYKNIVFLSNRSNISLLMSLKMLAIIFMGISGSIIGISIKSLKKNKKITFKDIYNERELLIEALLMSMMLPLKASPFILFVVSFILSLINLKVKLNKVAIMYLIVFIIDEILQLNTFDIAIAFKNPIALRWTDLLIGLGEGGIASTSIILILIGLIVLCFNPIYKKEIAISSIATFSLLVIIPNMISTTYGDIFKMLCGYNALFSFVFVAPMLRYTAYTTKGKILSGILIAVLTYFLILLVPYAASMVAILLVNIITPIIDRIFVIK